MNKKEFSLEATVCPRCGKIFETRTKFIFEYCDKCLEIIDKLQKDKSE